MELYDCVIIGGGPAGLSAAIYMGRFMRSTLILDTADGRWSSHEINENYFGFPDGVPVRKLRARGLEQALEFGAEYLQHQVTAIKKIDNQFITKTETSNFLSRSIILATGVHDSYPAFPEWKDYLGRSLFWCITCDGYKTRNKPIILVGQKDESACTAMQFLNYTDKISFVTHCLPGQHTIADKWLKLFEKYHIPFYEGVIKNVQGTVGYMEHIELEDGTKITGEFLFSQQHTVPNVGLAQELGVNLDTHGYIVTDTSQRTNIPFFYAAGDVTKAFAHQLVTAAHEGSMAAQSANYDLYEVTQQM